mmetsp:Transcript_37060/g.57941  ORF Transcript_37060/g.57941 Transcript_37060/m.57941 type:complete len:216 (+) Transcript_37060:596-1243(+)
MYRCVTDETDDHNGPSRLYQIHSATLESGVLTNSEVLNELRRLKKERGLRIGLSLSGVKQGETLRIAMQVPEVEGSDPDTGRLFDCVQATWNILEQSAGADLLEARKVGIDVIIKESMANGRLLNGPVGERVKREADALGCSPDALCIACVMAQPFKPLVLSGAATPAQVRSNAAALDLIRKEDSTPHKSFEKLCTDLRMDPKSYWDERSALTWN